MSEPTFKLEPIVWYYTEVINGQYVDIVVRNYFQYVGWTLYIDDGGEMPESCLTKGGSCQTILQAKDEVFTYASRFLHM
jgi:hypothetical protein